MQRTTHHREVPWVGGLVLIAVGLLMLGTYLVPDVGRLIVLALGLVFLTAFALTRTYGFLVAGGILTGLGAGVALTPYVAGGMTTGALITGSLAIGFAFAGVVGYLMHLPEAHPWPFVPAAILGTVAVFLALDATQALEYLGIAAAIAMIGGGGWLMIRRRDET